jgi:hypothetical protein
MKLYDVIRKEDQKKYPERFKDMAPLPHHEPPHKTRRSFREVFSQRKIVIIGAVVAVVAVIYLLGIRFVHATVVVTERRIPIVLNSVDFDLVHDDNSSTNRLSFQSMVTTATVTRDVYGSGIQNSVTKATGTVVFFNEYSTAKQTVKKGTTLTGANGKKYITQEAATVPGYTIANKQKAAGTSSEVSITAADTGDSYNTSGTTFSVSGWGNVSKTFYARSASAISGGMNGVIHTLTDSEREQVVTTLQAQLIEQLKRETRAQIPENLVTFPELQFPLIDTKTLTLSGGDVRFPASMTGTMVTYLIPRDLLEKAVAAKTIKDETFGTVSIPTITDLSLDLTSTVPTDGNDIPDSIAVRLSGSATVIAKVPTETLRSDLIGLRRGSADAVFETFPEIDTAKTHLYPFWSPIFPTTSKRITIETK